MTRPRPDLDGAPLLTLPEAMREAEELMLEFRIVYPGRAALHTAFRGAASYGKVRIVDPFVACGGVGELPPLYGDSG